MREIVNIPQIPYSVCMIDDVEYKRVKAMPEGSGNDLLRRGLYLQILIPRPEDRTRPQGPFPTVIYAPGGGWKSPLVKYRLPGIAGLAKRGFVVVMVEYRGREYYNSWREPVSDVRSAVRYVTKHASAYSADPENLFLLGDSAGGHLSMMASFDGSEFDDRNDDLSVPVKIRGVLSLFGPTDPARLYEEISDENVPVSPIVPIIKETFEDFAKCSDPEKISDLLAPAGIPQRVRTDAEIPPVLIAQGDRDILVPLWCAEELYDSLMRAGKEAELYILPGARHGDMRFYETDMLNRYERFIRKHSD